MVLGDERAGNGVGALTLQARDQILWLVNLAALLIQAIESQARLRGVGHFKKRNFVLATEMVQERNPDLFPSWKSRDWEITGDSVRYARVHRKLFGVPRVVSFSIASGLAGFSCALPREFKSSRGRYLTTPLFSRMTTGLQRREM